LDYQSFVIGTFKETIYV